MKKIVLTLISAVIAVCGFAQPKIQFDKTTYDFGQIHEEGGKVTARFNFTNVGNEDLVLKSVRPGCGCTAANYTKTAVAPGQSGFIDATYNPSGRPGSFNKNIKVTTNEPDMEVDKPTPHMIFIKGNVTPRPKTAFEKEGYTIGSGMVRFKDNSCKIDILNTEKHLDTFKVKNFWNRPVEISLDACEFATEAHRSFGPSIQGGEEGIIVIKYDGGKRNEFGSFKDAISFTTTDSTDAKKELYYQVTIKEDFSKMSAGKLKKAPVAVFSRDLIDFGQVKLNNSKMETITLTNNGKSDLIIRKVESGYGSVTVKFVPDTKILKKGESAEIQVSYVARHKKGKQNATILIITNDPNNSQVLVNIKADNLQ